MLSILSIFLITISVPCPRRSLQQWPPTWMARDLTLLNLVSAMITLHWALRCLQWLKVTYLCHISHSSQTRFSSMYSFHKGPDLFCSRSHLVTSELSCLLVNLACDHFLGSLRGISGLIQLLRQLDFLLMDLLVPLYVGSGKLMNASFTDLSCQLNMHVWATCECASVVYRSAHEPILDSKSRIIQLQSQSHSQLQSQSQTQLKEWRNRTILLDPFHFSFQSHPHFQNWI